MVNELLESPPIKVDGDAVYEEKLKEYYNSVEMLSKYGWNLEFNNRDANHANIVMTFLFKTAQKEIMIFAGNFGGAICDKDEYIASLTEAVNKGTKVSIIFEDEPNPDSRCLSALMKLRNEQKDVSIRVITAATKQAIIKNKLKHFTTVDGSKFRYETDGSQFRAFCNFDDTNTALLLKANFQKLTTGSVDYFK